MSEHTDGQVKDLPYFQSMIQPALHDDAFLADVADARATIAADRLVVWWLGQSGFLVS